MGFRKGKNPEPRKDVSCEGNHEKDHGGRGGM